MENMSFLLMFSLVFACLVKKMRENESFMSPKMERRKERKKKRGRRGE